LPCRQYDIASHLAAIAIITQGIFAIDKGGKNLNQLSYRSILL
jgi:hypothetical protein